MGKFWDSWELWEKMTFVMGVAIVVTILAGCVRLMHKHYQLRKFTKQAQRNKQLQQQTELTSPEMSGKGVRRGRAALQDGPDVPFGIRAIESGIEVEGVWISRGNSPATSAPGSPSGASTPGGRPQERSSSIPPLSMPEAAHSRSFTQHGSDSQLHIGPSSEGTETPRGRSPLAAGPAMGSSDSLASRGSSPLEVAKKAKARQSYKPRNSSHLRFSTATMLDEHGNPEPMSMRKSNEKTSDEILYDERQGSSASSSSLDDNEATPALPHHYEPKRPSSSGTAAAQNFSLPGKQLARTPIDMLPFTRQSLADLGSLADHRNSHAAETGQLRPRSRVELAQLHVSTNGSSNPFLTPMSTPPALEPSYGPSNAYVYGHTEHTPERQSSYSSYSQHQEQQQAIPLLPQNRESMISQHSRSHSPANPQPGPRTRSQSRNRTRPSREGNIESSDGSSSRASTSSPERDDRRQSKRLRKKAKGKSAGDVTQYTAQSGRPSGGDNSNTAVPRQRVEIPMTEMV